MATLTRASTWRCGSAVTLRVPLSTQGLLKSVGRRGFAVKAFSNKESWHALELRSILEGQAARLLAQKGASETLLAALDACLEVGDKLFEKRELDRKDEEHYGAMIVEACDWSLLKTLIDQLNLVPVAAPSVNVIDGVGYRRAFDLLFLPHGCHDAILEAIRRRDGSRAESLFREHAHQQRLSMFGSARSTKDSGQRLIRENDRLGSVEQHTGLQVI